MAGLNDILPGTYVFEITAHGVTTSAAEWQQAILTQIPTYKNSGYYISTMPTQPPIPREYKMILKVYDTYEDEMDGLLEDIIQVTGNFHADDGLHFRYTDPEGRIVREDDVRCDCGDSAVAAAEQILGQSKNET